MSIRCTPTASWAATPGGLRAARAARSAPRASAAEARSPIGPSCGAPTPARNRSAGILPLIAFSARSADRAARAPACGPGSEPVTRISMIARATRDRYQGPPAAMTAWSASGRGGGGGGRPRRFQQLDPLDLVRLGLLQIVRLDPDRDMPSADRDAQLPGPVEQILIDRRLRHQELGKQLAPGTDRHLAGPP